MPGLGRFVPAALRPYLRSAYRGLVPKTLDRPLTADECRGRLLCAQRSFLWQQDEAAVCPIRIHNDSVMVWSSRGTHPVTVTLTWLTSRRAPLGVPQTVVNLPMPIYPGETLDIPAAIVAPAFNGHGLIEVELKQTDGPNFADHGMPKVLIEFQVSGKAAEDLDYHKAYATADLTQDYWTVVGPKTKAEFDQLAANKMVHLKEVGVTPDSRILDVGCGTGQLAVPLENYLSDRGRYTGTDIGAEAIPYCRERFRRPNFRFVQNEMTSIPLHDETYDIVTYFSVFTHTFPDETALLLAESKRLLAPTGTIIGDVFTSSLVERCSGNRGMMELNKEHFLRLVHVVGLKAELLHDWELNAHLRRQVYVFRHA